VRSPIVIILVMTPHSLVGFRAAYRSNFKMLPRWRRSHPPTRLWCHDADHIRYPYSSFGEADRYDLPCIGSFCESYGEDGRCTLLWLRRMEKHAKEFCRETDLEAIPLKTETGLWVLCRNGVQWRAIFEQYFHLMRRGVCIRNWIYWKLITTSTVITTLSLFHALYFSLQHLLNLLCLH
jgi:hypothetical protein